MRTVSVRLSDLERAVVPIGFVGENQHTQVRIDCLKLYEEYQHAAASLTVKPPKGDSYPAVVVRDGNTVVWEITDSDLIYDGNGEIQLSFTVDEVVAKSYVGRIKISRSITPTGEVPEPLDDFLTRAGAALTAIPETIAVALQEAKDSGEFDGYSPTVVVTEITGGHQVTVTDVNGDHVFLVMDGVDGDPGTPGFSPTASVSKVGKKATISITDKDGTTTAEVNDGEDGEDGFSPSASVSKSGTKATISITDKNGTTTAEVSDGTDGTPGQDGYSPTATVTKSGSVATISITDKNGTTTAQISDGQDGDTGATPVISIGTVSTLTPGSDATASMDTTDPAHPVMSLGIPEGEPGEVTEAELFDATHGRWNEDNEPYLFRASGGDASVYEWEKDTLIGGTVAWNQLVPTANRDFTNNNTDQRTDFWMFFREQGGSYTSFVNRTISQTGWYYYVVSVTKTCNSQLLHSGSQRNFDLFMNVSVINGHKYMLTFNLKSCDPTTVGGFVVKDVQLFDLTQMFGSTIADYIYNLETGTPGAGIAWLKKHGFMTKPYYAYDAGSLQSVQASKHITRGFNAWDEEIEDGYYDVYNNGAKVSSDIWKRCKNLIPCVPNTNYYFYNNAANTDGFGALLFYDASRNQISYKTFGVKNAVIQTPKDCWFMSFYAKEIWIGDNICINLHWDGERDGEYEPYSEHVYPLDSDLTLRGIPKIANGKLFYDGDVYEADGTVTRKYGYVDMGTLSWSRVQWGDNSSQYVFTPVLTVANCGNGSIGNCIATGYTTITAGLMWRGNESDKVVAVNGTIVRFINNSYTDAATFKTAMSGVYILYELATPTTESADPFTNPQAVSPYGTEEYTDSRAVPIPVGHETQYLMDAFQYTEQKLSASQTLMELIVTANREEAMKATKAYTTGNLIIVNGTLYRTTTSIANGANLTVGTNVTATTIATELANLA